LIRAALYYTLPATNNDACTQPPAIATRITACIILAGQALCVFARQATLRRCPGFCRLADSHTTAASLLSFASPLT
jgi:hypothetical protein